MEEKNTGKTDDVDEKVSSALDKAAEKTDDSVEKFKKWWKDNKMWNKVLIAALAICIFLACFFSLASCSSVASSGCDKVCR